MEDTISQLQDLGVSRSQAKKALARYNNDVARAADFIFSGAPLSDDDDDENESIMETDEQLALRLSREEENNQQLNPNFNDSNTSKKALVTPPSPAATVEPTSTTANVYTSSPAQLLNESSLTWWKDPENPSERMALDDLPIGLRPPSYNFAYSPVLVQALFHVTTFQEAVLSFRPTAYLWGSPKSYWKGFGEPVPGYIKRDPETDVVSKDGSGNSTNEDATEMGLPPLIVESVPIEEEQVEFVNHVESELQLMSKSLEALAEMQKLFAFLGNTKRLYGNVSHYVRAVSTKLISNGWEFNDQTFEGKHETPPEDSLLMH
ncbi:hypothetical protein BD408DRAFT_340692 [Parasitella parasitica]|nr:hypothetical protein BD408DRAFT_340692 [Parasitella parasitica]